ncbi:hypothetical protein MN608_00233 [Microdochium nivale]|nr:hypothetical protein MN608_00233 [Microdochium nivale]
MVQQHIRDEAARFDRANTQAFLCWLDSKHGSSEDAAGPGFSINDVLLKSLREAEIEKNDMLSMKIMSKPVAGGAEKAKSEIQADETAELRRHIEDAHSISPGIITKKMEGLPLTADDPCGFRRSNTSWVPSPTNRKMVRALRAMITQRHEIQPVTWKNLH